MEAGQLIKAPMPIVFHSLLTAVSLVCSDKFDIERHGIVSPPSLNFLTAAESGERKSACDTAFLAGVRRYEAQEMESAKPRWAAYETKLLVWNFKLQQKEKVLREYVATGQATDELEAELVAIRLGRPSEPMVPRLLVSDITSEALDLALSRSPSVGLISDEGDVIFKSGAIRNQGKLNQCWDGKQMHVDRKTSGSFTILRPRLTVSIMAQPALVQRFAEKDNQRARQIGMLARFFVCFPESTQGYRVSYGEPPKPKYLPIFNDKTFEILNRTEPDEKTREKVPVVKLSPQALDAWQLFCNQVEVDLQHGQLLCDVKDSASKIGENAVRLAGLMHYFEGYEGDINFDTFNRARIICAWYLIEFKMLFGTKLEVPQNVLDAQLLEKHFLSHQFVLTPNGFIVEKNILRQTGPNQLRDKYRLDAALNVLNMQGKINYWKHNKTQMIGLSPHHYRSMISGQ